MRMSWFTYGHKADRAEPDPHLQPPSPPEGEREGEVRGEEVVPCPGWKLGWREMRAKTLWVAGLGSGLVLGRPKRRRRRRHGASLYRSLVLRLGYFGPRWGSSSGTTPEGPALDRHGAVPPPRRMGNANEEVMPNEQKRSGRTPDPRHRSRAAALHLPHGVPDTYPARRSYTSAGWSP